MNRRNFMGLLVGAVAAPAALVKAVPKLMPEQTMFRLVISEKIRLNLPNAERYDYFYVSRDGLRGLRHEDVYKKGNA